MPNTKTIRALNEERHEMAKKIHALENAIIALGGVPEPLNEVGSSKKEEQVKEAVAVQPEPPRRFFDRKITEEIANERYLVEIHDYDLRANWRKKIFRALSELETKTGTVPEIVEVLMKYEDERRRDFVFQSVTWYASDMSRHEKTIGVKKLHNRNHYFLKDQPPVNTTQ